MPRRISLQSHLSTDELERRYRKATNPVERSHFQILWQLAQGHASEQVAQSTGYSRLWIGQIAKRYNQGGPDAMGDHRRHNPGGKCLLTPEQQAALKQALCGPAPGGGFWNSRCVAQWIAQETGRAVSLQRGWDYLRLLGFTPQVPRPRHAKADPDAQDAFKKNSGRSGHAPSGRASGGGSRTLGLR